ncbi:MAG: DUF2793 domain-containing protein [Gammaproteobacteria bacterium]
MQKEWFHNESLQRIDMLLCAAVEGPPQNDPPVSPVAGQCFLIGDSPTGDWTGQAGAIAGFSDGGWRFVTPIEGAQLLVRSTGETMLRRNGSWEEGIVRAREVQVGGLTVLSARQASIPAPAGGSVIDPESRSAITAILSTLQAHGLIES